MNRNVKGLSEETKLRILKNAFVDATISGGKLILRRFDGTGENAGSVAGGGLTPAETDDMVASLVPSSSGSATSDALNAAIGAEVADPTSPAGTALSATYVGVGSRAGMFAALRSQMDYGIPTALSVVGDSTGNGVPPSPEWAYRLTSWLASQYPTFAVYHHLWNTNAPQQFDPPAVVQAPPNGKRGIVTNDTNLGYVAVADSADNSITGDIDLRWNGKLTDWTTPANEQVFLSKFAGAGNRSIYFAIGGGYGGRPYLAWTADGSTMITAVATAFTPPADGTESWIRATLDVDNGSGGWTVRFYLSTDGATWTQQGGDVTGTGVTSIYDSSVEWMIAARGGFSAPGNKLDGTTYRVDVRNGIGGFSVVPRLPELWPMRPTAGGAKVQVVGSPELHVLNGSHPGADVTYLMDTDRIKRMTPDYGQVGCIISCSHNDNLRSGPTYLADYDTLVSRIRARLPLAQYAVTSQNPQRTPRTNEQITAHATRCAQLIAYAARNGYSIVDAHRAFLLDGRTTLVNASDGVHPTDPDGNTVWGDTAIKAATQRV